jgi:PIN domain nuclease of toxin-antitoxin system
MLVLLDTHILIHAADGSISAARRAILNDSRNSLYYSSISLWEIAKLSELGRIKPAEGLQMFLDKLYHHPLYNNLELTPEVLVEATRISPEMHRDPADQLIVASARRLSAKLMTDDEKIQKCGLVKTI